MLNARKHAPANVLAAALVLVAGCAQAPLEGLSPTQAPPTAQAVELTDVPFFPQSTDLCGPAALATMLAHSNVAVDLATLVPEVYLPGRSGTLQAEMLAATRRFDRIALPAGAGLDALRSNLLASRPTVILQNLGVSFAPRWHYAVVVGYSPERDTFVLRSGNNARHRISARRLLRTWRRADYWGFSLLVPGQLPQAVNRPDYLQAVAALEGAGRLQAAKLAFHAAVERWPADRIANLGLANVNYATGDLEAAETLYKKIVSGDPTDWVAHNNLAEVLSDRGCRDQALELIDAAAAGAAERAGAAEVAGIRSVLAETRKEILEKPNLGCQRA